LQSTMSEKTAELQALHETTQKLEQSKSVEQERIKSLEEQLERSRAEVRSLLDRRLKLLLRQINVPKHLQNSTRIPSPSFKRKTLHSRRR